MPKEESQKTLMRTGSQTHKERQHDTHKKWLGRPLHTHTHAPKKHSRRQTHIYNKDAYTCTHRCIDTHRPWSKPKLWPLCSPALTLQDYMVMVGNRAFASKRQLFGSPVRTVCPCWYYHCHLVNVEENTDIISFLKKVNTHTYLGLRLEWPHIQKVPQHGWDPCAPHHLVPSSAWWKEKRKVCGGLSWKDINCV